MAYNINTIYNNLLYICRKERGAFITISEAMAALDMGQMEVFENGFKKYQINQEIVDELSPFKVSLYQFTSTASGIVLMPSGFQHLLGNVFTVSGSTVNGVKFLNDDEIPDALTSQLRQVSLNYPIACFQPNGFQLFPQTTQVGFFSYLRRPVTPVLDYTQVGRVITYNSATSTQIEFSDTYINNIISRALKYLGINLDEAQIEKFAQSQQQDTDI